MTDTQYRQALALFRYGLIAEFIQLPAGSRGLYARLRDKARAEYTIPGSTRTRVAPETLRHWLNRTTAVAGSTRCYLRGAPIVAERAHCPRRWPMRW